MEESTSKKIELMWNLLGFVTVASILALILVSLSAPHRIERYILMNDANNGMATCVGGEINWAPDTKCYCTNNPQQAIQDVAALNATLR
jgi:hypothetical protein